MTAVYEKPGVRFLYPENWELDNRDEESWPWSVSVHSPEGAFWAITVAESLPFDLDEMTDETLDAVREEFSNSFFEHDPASEEINGQTAHGYDINFFYLDFLIQTKLRSFSLGPSGCVVLYQAEQRDFDRLERVFQAITASLFQTDFNVED